MPALQAWMNRGSYVHCPRGYPASQDYKGCSTEYYDKNTRSVVAANSLSFGHHKCIAKKDGQELALRSVNGVSI